MGDGKEEIFGGGTQGAVLRPSGLCGVPPAQGMILARPLVHGTFQAWSLGLCSHGWAPPYRCWDLFLWGFVEPSLTNWVLLPGREPGRGPQASLGALFRAAPGGGEEGQQAEPCRAQPAFLSDRRCQYGARHRNRFNQLPERPICCLGRV